MKIYIYLDESGSLHKNEKKKFFLYGGLIFLDNYSDKNCLNKYKKKEIRIKTEIQNKIIGVSKRLSKLNKKKEFSNEDEIKYKNLKKIKERYKKCLKELKGSNLTPFYRNQLYKQFKNEITFIGKVNFSELKIDLEYSESIKRYKNLFLVSTIRNALEKQIRYGNLNRSEFYEIKIYSDNQNMSENDEYNFQNKLNEELFKGKYDNYFNFIEPLFKNVGKLKIKYVNSKHYELVRAADILCSKEFKNINNNKPIEKKHITFYHI